MDITKLKEMLVVDLKVDDTNLDTESLKIPQLHNKYLNFLQDEKMLLHSLKIKRKILLRDKWEYFTGKMDQETLKSKGWEPFTLKILKADISMYIDADSEVMDMDSRVFLQQEKVDYLQETIKAINNIQWHIRDAIAWRKFINGVN